MTEPNQNGTRIGWIEAFAYEPGKPIPLMPVGKYKRNGRTIDITLSDLQEMAANYEAGRPRWAIPIYAGHPPSGGTEPPRLGTAKRLYVDGARLFADPDWTDEGERTASSGEYGYTSPGVIWTKNGARYDDGAGGRYDNVIEHIALTNMPFFGEATAIFSAQDAVAEGDVETMGDHSDAQFGAMRRAMSRMQELVAEMGRLANDWAADLPEHKRPGGVVVGATEIASAEAFDGDGEDGDKLPGIEFVHKLACALNDVGVSLLGVMNADGQAVIDLVQAREAIKSALKTLIDQFDASAHGAAHEEQKMSEETQTPAVETQTDAFAAREAQRAEEFAALQARLEEANAQVEAFKAQAEQAKRDARLAEIRAQVDAFTALGAESATLAENLHRLEQLDADLYGYFEGLLKVADDGLAQSEAFKQTGKVTHTETETDAESFEVLVKRVHAEKFNSDPAKLEDALRAAQAERPDLFTSHFRA